MLVELRPGCRAAATATLLTVSLVSVAGCGSSGHKTTGATSTAKPAASRPTGKPVDLRTFRGRYVATLSSKGLVAHGVDTTNVGGPGVWHLSIGKRSLTFTPAPPGGGPTTYPIVALTRRQITLGPNADCSTQVGRTHKSAFRISETTAGLQFTTVTVACPEDGGSLAAAPWRRK